METFINVDGTELPSKTPALAYRALEALLAHAAVLAGVWIAIFPVVTPFATQLGRTLAVEVVLEVDTFSSVQTGRGGARVQVVLAPRPREPRRAGAGESRGGRKLQARPAVLTRLGPAGPGLRQAVALELYIGEPLQLGHLAVTIDVKRN